jgi:Uma2 family endonuclease
MSLATPPTGDALEFPDFPVRRFSVDEYRRMGETGVLTENDQVELLEGWIVPKMNHNPRHDATVDQGDELISERLPSPWRVRVQSAITLEDSEPEPDLAVVVGPAMRYRRRHPGPADIALLVEVSDTTLARDRIKRRIYARAGVPVYWIVNLLESVVECYTEPSGPTASPGYGGRTDFGLNDSVPLEIEGAEVARVPVRELLSE